MEITNVAITRRPSHGIAGANQGIVDHGFAYTPSPGFVGKDEFVVTVDSKGTVQNGTANIHGKVEIDVSVVVTSK